MPLHIIDTAGLRESPDEIEQEGIRRAWQEIEKADLVLLVVDSQTTESTDPKKLWPEFIEQHDQKHKKILVLKNKCDLSNEQPGELIQEDNNTLITLSAKTGDGIQVLRNYLKDAMGFQAGVEGQFIARRRHLDALQRAEDSLRQAQTQLGAGELLAMDLRQAQDSLSEITGQFTSDDLLGEIFSSFCIGK